MEIEKLDKPQIGDVHRIYWHPQYGDVRRSNIHVIAVGITTNGLWLRVPGQPVIVVDWEQWGRMTATPEPPAARGEE
jgi:hypothetical protein